MAGGEIITINGQRLYHEACGEGQSLIVLHGGITVLDPSAPLVQALTRTRRVHLFHLQGHGFSPMGDRPLSYEAMADDVAGLIAQTIGDRCDVLGYSLGGGVALQTAIRHPNCVGRLVCMSTTMRHNGSFPEVTDQFNAMQSNSADLAANIAKSPLANAYPNVEWQRLFAATGAMNAAPYDWSDDVAALKQPTLLVFADADSVTPKHIIDFWEALGGGKRDAGMDGSLRPCAHLSVVPGTTHYSLLENEALPSLLAPFLAT